MLGASRVGTTRKSIEFVVKFTSSICRKWAGELIACIVVVGAMASGVLAPMSLAVQDLAYSIVSRPASGEIVVVQIDARSLQRLNTWPWPRSRHAQVIDSLNRAGASIIAMDIDFSSASNPSEDLALAAAIGRARGSVVLPSFVQPASVGGSDLIETGPLSRFQAHALVGNANILATRGLVRKASLGVQGADGGFRPSFAALVGQDDVAVTGLFGIDYSIELKSIPHFSYIDLYEGRFKASDFANKRVIVGATAVELADRVSVPVSGVIAGVDLQALIAESILQGRMLRDAGVLGQILLAIVTIFYLRPSQLAWKARDILVPVAIVAVSLVVASLAAFEAVGLQLDPIAGGIAILVSICWAGTQELAARSRTVLRERSTSSLRRAMIELIVEESSDGIVVASESGRVELCNEQAARLLSVTRKSLTGRQVKNFLPVYDSIGGREADTAASNRCCDLSLDSDDGEITVEVSVRRTRSMHWQVHSRGDSGLIDVYTIRDVTSARKARANEVRAQEERLLAERAKNNFVANMSHELRTPLNAIIGFSEMLANEVLGQVQQRAYVEHAEMVAKSGHHLLAVVNNVIDVARLDSEALEVSRTDCVFEDVVSTAQELVMSLGAYKEQKISVVVAPDARHLECDHKLLKHIVYNLLSNAAKFSPPQAPITISAWTEGRNYEFEIVDHGCGIDPEILPRIAQLFGHAESGFTRPHDGLGVGLHLVRRCLEKLGGSLSINTAKGEGTRVRVSLPDAVASEETFRAA